MPAYEELQSKVRRLCESAQWSELELVKETLPLGLAVEIAQLLVNCEADEIEQFEYLSRLRKAADIASSSTIFELNKFGDAGSSSTDGIRTSSSKWKPAVIGIAHELLSRCSENEYKTIDQIMQRDSFSTEEENFLKLMKSVLKVHIEPETATDGFVLSLSNGKITQIVEQVTKPEEAISEFGPVAEGEQEPTSETESLDDQVTNPAGGIKPSSKPLFKNVHKLPSQNDLAEILARNPDESKAWGWVPFVSPISARDILKYLRKREWQPEHEGHRKAFRKVQKLARSCVDIASLTAGGDLLSKLVCRAGESFAIDNDDRNSSPVTRILCDSSDNWLVTSALTGDPFPVRIWSLSNGKTHRHLEFAAGTNFIYGMGLNHRSDLLAVEYCRKKTPAPPVPAIDTARIMICSIPEMQLVKLLAPEQELLGAHSPIFSPDSKLLYAVNEKSIRIWDTGSWTLKQTLPILPKSSGEHAFIHDLSIDFETGQFTAIVSTYNANTFSVQLRKLSDGSLISSAHLPTSSSRLAGTNLLKDKVLTISGPSLTLWTLPKMQQISSWTPPGFDDGDHATRSVSQDGNWLAIARVNDESASMSPKKRDSEIFIVRLSDWKVVETLRGPFNDVLALQFAPGDSKLYVGTSNGVWKFIAPKGSDPKWQRLLERLINTAMHEMNENEIAAVNVAANSTWLSLEQKSWIKFIVALNDLS